MAVTGEGKHPFAASHAQARRRALVLLGDLVADPERGQGRASLLRRLRSYGVPLEVDHVVPRSLMGGVRVLCHDCHQRKTR